MKFKIIIIIGSEGQLGKALEKKLSIKEYKLILADKTIPNNFNLKEVKKNTYQSFIDVTDENSVKNFHYNCIKKFKKIDGIVFAITYKTHDFYYPFEEFSYDSWKSVINVELGGAFLISKYFGKTLAFQKKGSVIFLSSIYGIVGNDHSIYKGSNLASVYSNKNQTKPIFSNAAYNTAKGGLISFTKFLSTYWVGKNVRFNSISPGGIKNKKENKKFINNYSNKVPLKRKAHVDEICDSIIFLLSDKSKYINGHNLVIDGGFTIW